jgi:hypothetical protein
MEMRHHRLRVFLLFEWRSNGGRTGAAPCGGGNRDAIVSSGPLWKCRCHCRCRCVIFLYGGAPRDEKEQSSLDSLLLDDSRIGCVRWVWLNVCWWYYKHNCLLSFCVPHRLCHVINPPSYTPTWRQFATFLMIGWTVWQAYSATYWTCC